jgi:uncharacterized protein (TIGR03086 family)
VADISHHHRRALEETRTVVAAISPDQLPHPTLDGDWDVRHLLNHVVTGNWWAAELGAGRTIAEVGDRLDGDVLGDDPLAAYDESARAAAEVFEVPGALDAPCAVSYGPVPGSVFAGHRFVDVLIHGWDLAMSTGQDATLDPELVDVCIAVMEPQQALLNSGAFGTRVDVPADADAQTRLLGMLGRRSG